MPELAKVALGFAGRFRFCVAKSRRLAAKKTPILAKGEEIGQSTSRILHCLDFPHIEAA